MLAAKIYIYIHTKKIGFLSIQPVRWCNERYADLVHMQPDKSRTHGRKHVAFVHILFLLLVRSCALFSQAKHLLFLPSSVMPFSYTCRT